MPEDQQQEELLSNSLRSPENFIRTVMKIILRDVVPESVITPGTLSPGGPPLTTRNVLPQDVVPEDQQQEELMESISKGNFSMRILYEQLSNIQKMGPVGGIMSMIPGLSNSDLFSQAHPSFACPAYTPILAKSSC